MCRPEVAAAFTDRTTTLDLRRMVCSLCIAMVSLGAANLDAQDSPAATSAPADESSPSDVEVPQSSSSDTEADAAVDEERALEAELQMLIEAADSTVKKQEQATPAKAGFVQFSFERAPWRDVIRWIADEAGLALQYEDLPTGSFSYTDNTDFSHRDAIDRLNLFLLPQGYSLVQSGRLLTVINLSDPRSMQQLDALARLVTADQLDELPSYEVVKCLFTLGELEAQEATQELVPLQLMTTPSVFEKTNRLMITDSVDKLRNVRAILQAFEPKTLDNGTVMRNFALEHVSAEDILIVARPHLGLATDEMIGIDVSLSADLQGENIFVTGVEDKVKLIESLVQELDKPGETLTTANGEMVLKSHMVTGGNVETVYNVLKTLLAGKTLRLSMDETAGTIVALADPQTQVEISQTVEQLQATEAAFEVIPLRTADPFFVISLLEEMLDLPDSLTDPDDIPPDTPRIDADPGNRRLFVRAKQSQIDQIKAIVAGLDQGQAPAGEAFRLLPLRGEQAISSLELAAKFWHQGNPIILYPGEQGALDEPATERVLHQESDEMETPAQQGKRVPTQKTRLTGTGLSDGPRTARLLSNGQSQAAAIRCEVTPDGLVLQSNDVQALDALEQRLLQLAGSNSKIAAPPTVFYLKFVKPEDAIRVLAELLDGGEAANEGAAGTLVNGYVDSPGGGYLGSLVTSRDGTMTMMFGTITVVADPRLNRLIAQGMPEDIERIEDYLKIIDKDKGLTAVQTYGTAHVIELQYTDANQVAATLREAYAGRVAASSSSGSQPGQPPAGGRGQSGGEERGRNEDRDERSQRSGGKAGAATRNLEPQMTIAVHEPSNSLIVTAPEQLFAEVEALVKVIDTRSQETVEIVGQANTALLEAVFNPEARSRGGSSGSSSRRSSGREALEAMFRSRSSR